jgi:arginyl-tRNA synthetase
LKDVIKKQIDLALSKLEQVSGEAKRIPVDFQIERPKNEDFGDYSSNVALKISKSFSRAPREIAELIVPELISSGAFSSVTVAGAGFINFRLKDEYVFATIDTVLELSDEYGENKDGDGRSVQIEFVSANPTGPLHIGHGRGAAIGSAVARLLELSGFEVCREYYVNDAGRQIDILAVSTLIHMLRSKGKEIELPEKAYQGDYIRDIAQKFQDIESAQWSGDLAFDASGENPEKVLDSLISVAKNALGEELYSEFRNSVTEEVLAEIKSDLEYFGVEFDNWYSESSLESNHLIDSALSKLKKNGFLYEKDGATWFRSSDLGDEKDRVVERENGTRTYFASDIAYHLDKYKRGFDEIINVWGADHHGYVPRVQAAVEALGESPSMLHTILVQFAALIRRGDRVPMSTRSGEYVTLRSLLDEVGRDAARFFYVARRADQHLDFDVDLAAAKSTENPVYYIQYAHARVCSVYRQLDDKGWEFPESTSYVGVLTGKNERKLALAISRYPVVIRDAATAREPHLLATYLRELATEFHTYYNNSRFLVSQDSVRGARLRLIGATKQVLANGLSALGVSAPEKM